MGAEPPWVQAARKYLGVAEIPGKDTAPMISRWLKRLGAWWDEDATPWCGTFVAACLADVSLPRPQHWYRARAYLDYGVQLGAPLLGCLVVFSRSGGGHVGFVVGRDPRARLLVLGGNQRDAVNISPFDTARVLGYRWPPGAPIVTTPPPLIDSSAASSTHEA